MAIFEKEIQNKLDNIINHYKHNSELLSFEEVITDLKLCQKLSKENEMAQDLVNCYNKLLEFLKQKEYLDETMRKEQNSIELFSEEKLELEKNIEAYRQKVLEQLKLANATEEKITIEIVNINNSELCFFAINAYQNYCKTKNLSFDCVNLVNTFILHVSGKNAYNYFKDEIGNHREKEEQNNFAFQIFIYKSIEKGNYSFNEDDLKIETFRSNGAGGQHINRTDSAIRVIHLKSGIVATCQDERSQFQNKERAIENLKEKVRNYYDNEYQNKLDDAKKEQLKQIKQGLIARIYDISGKITENKNNHKTISLDDFEQGKL